MLLCSLDFALGPTSEIALLGSKQDTVIIEMLQALRARFLPNKSTILVCGKEIREITPFTKNLPPDEEMTAAYVCTDHVCSLPATSPKEMMKLLSEK
jgi:uncharacterized protein YyaL (SSP411 family)